jgi:hypothetical protein
MGVPREGGAWLHFAHVVRRRPPAKLPPSRSAGTMDGANIEIAAEIDRENMFIFGAEAHQVRGGEGGRRRQSAQRAR